MAKVFINGRFIDQTITGVQRYGRSVMDAIQNEDTEVLKPAGSGRFAGIRWEQFVLPRQLEKMGQPLLINLCNTAPHGYRNQIVTIHDLAPLEHP